MVGTGSLPLGRGKTMRPSNCYRSVAAALVLLLIATPGQARRLMEIDGIELRGTAQVVMLGAATCHIREQNHSAEEYERLKVNEGKPLNLWRLEYYVYNGSGKALDHLIARYNIESQWPPCTNWSYNPESPITSASWSSQGGHIQRTAKPFSVAPDETLTEELFFIVFHEDTPRFANWSVDYNFAAEGQATPAETPTEQPAQTQATTPPPAQAQAAAPPPQASGMPAGISAGETCAGKPEGSECWQELDNRPGCYVWNGDLSENETATWSSECTGGLAQGTGEMIWNWESDGEQKKSTSTGEVKDGKRHGQWVIRYASGTVVEGPYVDGKQHGRWVIRYANGDVAEGPAVDGKRHGQWVERGADGDVSEGPYVDGKRHGQWVTRWANGGGSEGPYVDGKRHGQWVARYASGSVDKGPYVDGKRHGHWVERDAEGDGWEGPYVDGKKDGVWSELGSDGSLMYIDGHFILDWVELEPVEIRKALDSGLDVNMVWGEGDTILGSAVSWDASAEVIATLLEAGADINVKGGRILSWALADFDCDEDYIAVAKLLLEAGADARYRSESGYTPLHSMAAVLNRCKISTVSAVISMLVDRGANIDARREYGYTPLHEASENKGHSMVVALINSGADVNSRTEFGETPLHLSVQNLERDRLNSIFDHYPAEEQAGKIQELVDRASRSAMSLLAAGADPMVRETSDGKTPLDYIGDDSLLRNTKVYWELRDAQYGRE